MQDAGRRPPCAPALGGGGGVGRGRLPPSAVRPRARMRGGVGEDAARRPPCAPALEGGGGIGEDAGRRPPGRSRARRRGGVGEDAGVGALVLGGGEWRGRGVRRISFLLGE